MVTYMNTEVNINDCYNISLLQEILLIILKFVDKLLLSLGLYHLSEIKSRQVALTRSKLIEFRKLYRFQ